jgi:F420-dependent oxidoreductase-like protein
MRIAIHSGMTNRGSIEQIVDEVRKVAESGLAGYWAPMLNGHDTLTALAVAGQQTGGVELGTAVVPMPLRPPFALAQQIATVQQVVGGRLVVGLGPGHEALVRSLFGLDWAPPLDTTRRYVRDLRAIMAGTSGQRVAVAPGQTTQLLLGTVNPAMARLAAELADGVVTWAAGPRTVTDVIQPAAGTRTAAGPFRIVAALPLCVTDDVAAARAAIDRVLGANDTLPSYRKLLAREGAAGIAEVALVGSPADVTAGLDAFAAAGVTDFAAHVLAPNRLDRERTWEFLAARAAKTRPSEGARS